MTKEKCCICGKELSLKESYGDDFASYCKDHLHIYLKKMEKRDHCDNISSNHGVLMALNEINRNAIYL